MYKKAIYSIMFSFVYLITHMPLNGMQQLALHACNPTSKQTIKHYSDSLTLIKNSTNNFDKERALKLYGSIHRKLEEIIEEHTENGDTNAIEAISQELRLQIEPVTTKNQFQLIIKLLENSKHEVQQ